MTGKISLPACSDGIIGTGRIKQGGTGVDDARVTPTMWCGLPELRCLRSG
jgi:hypothetical protein